jgi:hypothetical protein
MIHVRNEVEANLLEAILATEGIPHYIKAYRDPAYRGIWTFNDAYGQVECPPEHRDRVAEILQGIRRQDG